MKAYDMEIDEVCECVMEQDPDDDGQCDLYTLARNTTHHGTNSPTKIKLHIMFRYSREGERFIDQLMCRDSRSVERFVREGKVVHAVIWQYG